MYEVKTAAEVLRMLETDKDKGLKRREAMERKAKYGANRLKDQEQKSLGQMILEQLNDPLILILVVAMAISLMLHELGDAIIIVTVVVLNATVGIIQEGKAGKAVEALLRRPSSCGKGNESKFPQRIWYRGILCCWKPEIWFRQT